MIRDDTADDGDLSSVPGSCWGHSGTGHRPQGTRRGQEQFADGNGPSFSRRASLGTASMDKQPDRHAPRDVIMSSIWWCLPPSWGLHLPAALYSNTNVLPAMSCSMRKVLVILSLGWCLHVCVVLQDTSLRAMTASHQVPLSSASSLAHTQGF